MCRRVGSRRRPFYRHNSQLGRPKIFYLKLSDCDELKIPISNSLAGGVTQIPNVRPRRCISVCRVLFIEEENETQAPRSLPFSFFAFSVVVVVVHQYASDYRPRAETLESWSAAAVADQDDDYQTRQPSCFWVEEQVTEHLCATLAWRVRHSANRFQSASVSCVWGAAAGCVFQPTRARVMDDLELYALFCVYPALPSDTAHRNISPSSPGSLS